VSEPLDRLLNAEVSEHIRKALLATPEKYRVVVVLRDLEGLSTEEAAQALKIKPETVKVRLHRGRLFLKTRIKVYFEDYEKNSPRS
jgi:RNA polymerase sigma-70 factor, ECF subfamily